MPRQTKLKHSEPGLQPWQHEEQLTNALVQAQIPINGLINPESQMIIHQNYKDFIDQKQKNQSKTISFNRNTFSKHEDRKNVSNSSSHGKGKKYSQINFVKKNQQSVKSYGFMYEQNEKNYNNYNKNESSEKFVPLNPSNLSPYRRLSINTTYIGYYDEQPFFIDNQNKSRIKQNYSYKKNKSFQIKNRPKTSTVSIYEGDKIRSSNYYMNNSDIQDQNMNNMLSDKTAITVTGYHLQKVLKIKQKLRQKLRKNSEKKDYQRGLYVKSQMKIQQAHIYKVYEKQRQNQCYQGFKQKQMQGRSLNINKNKKSLTNIDSAKMSKQKIRVDKYKQYLKIKEAQQKSNSSLIKEKDKNKFFGVLGGAIYK